MHMMSIAYSAANAVHSDHWFDAFKVLILNVAMLTMFLHLNNFGLGLASLADFLNSGARVPTSAGVKHLADERVPVKKILNSFCLRLQSAIECH